MMKNKRKSKILKLAKGFRNARSTKYKQAKQGVIRAGQHAFAHRRKKKRVMRKHWQIKISYAVKNLTGLSYSKFIDQLTKKDIAVDRKIMADMITNDMTAFARFVSGCGIDVDGSKVVETKQEVEKIEKEEKAAEKKEALAKEDKKETPAKKATSGDADDLTKIEGIGPVIAKALNAGGIMTFADLAAAKDEDTQAMITDVRGNHDATTWNEQAELARDGKWDELKALKDALDGGKEK